MTCTCSQHNPWRRLREGGEPSIFMADPTFRPRDAAGRSHSQINSANVARFEREPGYSLGTIDGISAKADHETARRNDQRRLVAQQQRRK